MLLVGQGFGREGGSGSSVMGQWRMGNFGRNHPFENLVNFSIFACSFLLNQP